VWKVNSQGAIKIKNSYFTPELAEIGNPDFGGFEVKMSLDHQNIVLVESHSKNKDTNKNTLVVLIFDLYTLDKISEYEIENVNTEYIDENNSEFSDR
jgi:hypothetical protein